jgi:hypothetical protein
MWPFNDVVSGRTIGPFRYTPKLSKTPCPQNPEVRKQRLLSLSLSLLLVRVYKRSHWPGEKPKGWVKPIVARIHLLVLPRVHPPTLVRMHLLREAIRAM